MEHFQEVLDRLQRAAVLGHTVAKSGSKLIGHIPHRGSDAYLHEVHSPLSAREIAKLEKELGGALPDSLRELLSVANGLHIYADSLSLYGLRRSNTRSVENRQPYDMVDPNTYERPDGLPDGFVVIGSYGEDRSKLVMERRSGRVFRCPRYEASPILNRWRSLDAMLLAEVKRLARHFDGAGRQIDENRPTTPEPAKPRTARSKRAKKTTRKKGTQSKR